MSKKIRYTPSVSLDESERKWIKKQAEKEGISYTNYMRKVVLCELPQSEIPYHRKDRELNFSNGVSHAEMRKVLDHELPKWGNNLNQIARKLNEGAPADDKMFELMGDIRRHINKIGRKILRGLG